MTEQIAKLLSACTSKLRVLVAPDVASERDHDFLAEIGDSNCITAWLARSRAEAEQQRYHLTQQRQCIADIRVLQEGNTALLHEQARVKEQAIELKKEYALLQLERKQIENEQRDVAQKCLENASLAKQSKVDLARARAELSAQHAAHAEAVAATAAARAGAEELRQSQQKLEEEAQRSAAARPRLAAQCAVAEHRAKWMQKELQRIGKSAAVRSFPAAVSGMVACCMAHSTSGLADCSHSLQNGIMCNSVLLPTAAVTNQRAQYMLHNLQDQHRVLQHAAPAAPPALEFEPDTDATEEESCAENESANDTSTDMRDAGEPDELDLFA